MFFAFVTTVICRPKIVFSFSVKISGKEMCSLNPMFKFPPLSIIFGSSPLKSLDLGRDRKISLSKKSHILLFLKVTVAAISRPSLNLNPAMDFFDFTNFVLCPAIRDKSCIIKFCIFSRSPAVLLATSLPKELFNIIFFMRGTAIGFLYPNFFIMAGITSFLYFSFNFSIF